MKPERLVAGLGNPGAKYKGTRHNAGYMVLAELATRFADGKPKNQFQANVLDVKIQGKNVLLLCPTTFMNLSGQSVQAAMSFYKLLPEQLLVVCDDIDLPLARLRMRESGGSGGQKGLKDIIARLGTEQFARLRLGIGRPGDHCDTADYVLSSFGAGERDTVSQAVKNAADAVTCWVTDGTQVAMNRFN